MGTTNFPYQIRPHIYLFLYLASGRGQFLMLHGMVGGESNKRKNIFFTHALYSHSLVRIELYNLLFSCSFIFFCPCTFLVHIKLKIITANVLEYSVKYFGILTFCYSPFFYSPYFKIYCCGKVHCDFSNEFLRKNMKWQLSLILLVHSHNYAALFSA